jgi:serine/threonine protein kinase
MWALGCVLYGIATGCLPFDSPTRQETADSITSNTEVRFPPGTVLDPACEECIRALLNADPVQRPSAVQVLRSDWLSLHYESALAENNMTVPHAVVDAEMGSFGFPADHVAMSRIDSEYVKSSQASPFYKFLFFFCCFF